MRNPALRNLAKNIVKGDWQTYLLEKPDYFEERMLTGFVIGAIPLATEDKLNLVEGFIPLVNSWAICDSFVPGLKIAKKNHQLVYNFIQPYLESQYEFYQRFGLVMILSHKKKSI